MVTRSKNSKHIIFGTYKGWKIKNSKKREEVNE